MVSSQYYISYQLAFHPHGKLFNIYALLTNDSCCTGYLLGNEVLQHYNGFR